MYPSPQEKTPFATLNPENQKTHSVLRHALRLVGLAAILLLAASQFASPIRHYSQYYQTNTDGPCSQSAVLNPTNPLWKSIGEIIHTNAFKNRAVDWLAGAVRIP
jgi:Gly-Xaa carboxypeptidase